jgi:hypothetical protein
MASDGSVKQNRVQKFLSEMFMGKNVVVLSEQEFEKTKGQIAEKAMQDERQWHSGKGSDLVESSMDANDYSYLYENQPMTADEAKVKLPAGRKGVRDSFFKVFEAFAGGWVATWSMFSRGQTTDELHLMQDAVHARYYSDPHCRSIIDNWTNYTIGGGLKVMVDVPKVQEVIDEFRKRNKMKSREKKYVKRYYMDGELFMAYHDKDGKVYVRRIQPDEITEIKTNPNDMEEVHKYKWEFEEQKEGTQQTYKSNQWVDDINSPTRGLKKSTVKKPIIHFIKTTDEQELRGRVPLQPVLKWLKYYEDWQIDRIRLNHERAKVVWIKEVKGKSPTATERDRRAPRGGVMLVETDNVRYRIESADLQAGDAKEDGLAILYTIGAGSNLPIHILNQRSDQAVYASIRKADTPFSQFIRGNQEFLEEAYEDQYRYVIEVAVDNGDLPKFVQVPDYSVDNIMAAFALINRQVAEGVEMDKVIEAAKKVLGKEAIKKKKVKTQDMPITLEFPEVIREDPKTQADVMKIHREMGIASLSTLSSKAGYNWKQELAQILVEREFAPEEPEPEKSPDNKPEKKADKGNGEKDDATTGK